MSFKPSIVVFCLKRNHCNLTTEKYAENLTSPLDSVNTVEDLSNVMQGISGRYTGTTARSKSRTTRTKSTKFKMGEHVVCCFLLHVVKE